MRLKDVKISFYVIVLIVRDIEEVKTLKKSIFKVAEAVEKFAVNYSKRHLSGMGPSERIVSPTMGEISTSKPV